VSIKAGSKSFDVSCTASDSKDFGRFINLHRVGEPVEFPADGEVVIVRKMEHDYGIEPGDEITIKDGFKEMKAKVSGVCDNYVNDYIYMSEATYEKGFGKKPDIKTAFVLAEGDKEEKDETVIRNAAAKAASYGDAAAVSVNLDVRDNVSRMMKSLDSVVYVVILSAALLAFIVLYNLTNINITERIREIATIKVLGFYHLETSLYVFRENFFMCIAAALVGIPLGRWLLKFVIDNIVVKVVYFEPRLTNMDIVVSVILTFVFAFLVNLSMQKRLSSISMTESLKSVE
jgi:putative ABC transport system permease protein